MDTEPSKTDDELNALTQHLARDGMDDELSVLDEDPSLTFNMQGFGDYMESDIDQPVSLEHDFLP